MAMQASTTARLPLAEPCRPCRTGQVDGVVVDSAVEGVTADVAAEFEDAGDDSAAGGKRRRKSWSRSISAASCMGSRQRRRSMVSLQRSPVTTSSPTRAAMAAQSAKASSVRARSAVTCRTPMRSLPSSSGTYAPRTAGNARARGCCTPDRHGAVDRRHGAARRQVGAVVDGGAHRIVDVSCGTQCRRPIQRVLVLSEVLPIPLRARSHLKRRYTAANVANSASANLDTGSKTGGRQRRCCRAWPVDLAPRKQRRAHPTQRPRSPQL